MVNTGAICRKTDVFLIGIKNWWWWWRRRIRKKIFVVIVDVVSLLFIECWMMMNRKRRPFRFFHKMESLLIIIFFLVRVIETITREIIDFHLDICVLFWFVKPSDEYDLSKWRNDSMSALLTTGCGLFMYFGIRRIRNCSISWFKSECQFISTEIRQWSSTMRRNGTKTSFSRNRNQKRRSTNLRSRG